MSRPARSWWLLAALTVVVGAAPASAKPASYVTAVEGEWTLHGCVPTAVPRGATFPITLTGLCTGTVTGGWTGTVVASSKGVLQSDLTLDSTTEISLRATANDGTCGILNIHQRSHVDGDTGAITGVSRITLGKGRWAGSTGSYKIDGVFTGGLGFGGFKGTWRRPGRATTASLSHCRVTS